MSDPSFTLTNDSITIVWEDKLHVIKKGNANYPGLFDAVVKKEWDKVPGYLTVAKSVQTWADGKFSIDGGKVKCGDEEVPPELAKRIMKMVSLNESPLPVFNFWEKLKKNPSWRSVNQLWSFLEHQGIPLTEDGCFLAYKGVRNDYRDQHSGKFDNSPGNIHRMPRNQISDDPKEACHEGFHVGALEYARTFSQRVVVCKVSPEHVVCVPYDHSFQKMRVCEYEVIGNHGAQLPSTTYKPDKYEDDEPENEVEETTEDDVNEVEDSEEDDVSDINSDGTIDDEDDDLDDEEEEDEEDEEEDGEEVDEDEEDEESDDPFDHSAEPADPLEVTHEDADREHKKAKKKAAKKKDKKPSKVPSSKKKAYEKFSRMKYEKLAEQSIEDLRKYATYNLQIIGASKIPGGKPALLTRILDVRKKK